MPDTARELRRLQARTARGLDSLLAQLEGGTINARQAAGRARTLLRVAHSVAAALGAERGGGGAEVRKAVADRAIRAEAEFIRGFIRDVRRGRYAEGGEKGRRARAALYALKLAGTANEAWRQSQPAEALIWWRLGATDQHCPDCPPLAAGSPYTRDTLPTTPASGDVSCVTRCRCRLETDGGLTGFANA